MIDGELLTERMRFARQLSRCGPGPVYVIASPYGRLYVVCERDVLSVMLGNGWELYDTYLRGERI
jgi:hypothetical protein